jgi:hypothetical protein
MIKLVSPGPVTGDRLSHLETFQFEVNTPLPTTPIGKMMVVSVSIFGHHPMS